MVGIVGYGAAIPRRRIKVEEIAKVWGADADRIRNSLLLHEKSVPSPDEDTITLAVEASRRAVRRAGIDPARIGAVYVGSESHPYAVKPSGTVVAEALGATPEVHCADFEFACKAGTEAMFVALSHVKAGEMDYALAVGADTSQGAPGDALEYSASAGAAAFIMGREHLLASCDASYAFMTDTPDFWRREHEHYPQHGYRFTGEQAYFKHIMGAVRGILEKTGLTAGDFRFVVFHQPNGKFPFKVGADLGFSKEQILDGWLVNRLGNTYSGASPIGLTAILDVARPGDRILMVSYGSGAGSDAFVWTAQPRLAEVQELAEKTRTLLDGRRIYVDYGTYAKLRGKILRNA